MTLEQFQATDQLHRDNITKSAWEAAQDDLISKWKSAYQITGICPLCGQNAGELTPLASE